MAFVLTFRVSTWEADAGWPTFDRIHTSFISSVLFRVQGAIRNGRSRQKIHGESRNSRTESYGKNG
jgi:hypothetical protein